MSPGTRPGLTTRRCAMTVSDAWRACVPVRFLTVFFATAFFLAGAFLAAGLRAGAFFAGAFLAAGFEALPDSTASLKFLSGVMRATRLALTRTCSPVAGFRAMRAGRSMRLNFAKPEIATSSPLATLFGDDLEERGHRRVGFLTRQFVVPLRSC